MKIFEAIRDFGSLLTVVTLFIFIITLIIPGGEISGQKGNKDKADKEICITFNELPAAQSFDEVDRDAITYLILEALRQHKVPAAGFVVGNSIENSYDILGQWLNGGHTLGTMTYSNQDLHELSIEQFISETERGIEALEPILSGFGQKKRYFRFPFLHYGNTVKAKKQLQLFLEDRHQIIAHATVVPEDYLYNLTLEKMGKIPDSTEYENLMNEYLNHVFDELERAEQMAKRYVDRPVKQILLLRANRLNAIYLDELLRALEDYGYKFISLDNALKDKIYSRTEAYFGSERLGYIEMLMRSDPDFLPAERR